MPFCALFQVSFKSYGHLKSIKPVANKSKVVRPWKRRGVCLGVSAEVVVAKFKMIDFGSLYRAGGSKKKLIGQSYLYSCGSSKMNNYKIHRKYWSGSCPTWPTCSVGPVICMQWKTTALLLDMFFFWFRTIRELWPSNMHHGHLPICYSTYIVYFKYNLKTVVTLHLTMFVVRKSTHIVVCFW